MFGIRKDFTAVRTVEMKLLFQNPQVSPRDQRLPVPASANTSGTRANFLVISTAKAFPTETELLFLSLLVVVKLPTYGTNLLYPVCKL